VFSCIVLTIGIIVISRGLYYKNLIFRYIPIFRRYWSVISYENGRKFDNVKVVQLLVEREQITADNVVKFMDDHS